MEKCIFCKIASKEAPAVIRYEDNDFIAFDDICPSATIHIVLIPKKHIEGISQISEVDSTLMGRMIIRAKNIAKTVNLEKDGYRLVINDGYDAGQVVHHLHMHILGGNILGPLA